MRRKRKNRSDPPKRTPCLYPAPGADPDNDEAWLEFFLTASDGALCQFEKAIKGGDARREEEE